MRNILVRLFRELPVLAEVGVYIRYHEDLILKPNFKKLKVHKELDENIAILKLFPGINQNIVRNTLTTPGLKALILETFGQAMRQR